MLLYHPSYDVRHSQTMEDLWSYSKDFSTASFFS
jgi:hypothetical protein